jgi:uncharacterized protein
MKLAVYVLLRTIVATLVVSSIIVFTQTFQIFPAYLDSLFGRTAAVPSDVEETFLDTSHGDSVQLWKIRSLNPSVTPRPLLYFHGNAESISGRPQFMRSFAKLGYDVYMVEYPGYLSSTGRPTEKGIYAAADAALEYISKQAAVPQSEIVIFGHSIGTGPASYAARHSQAKVLFLVSPYSSLTKLVSELPFFGYLSYFLWFKFPSDQYLSELKETDVNIFHGEVDATIPAHHTLLLKAAYKGTGSFSVISNPIAGHNELLFLEEAKILELLASYLAKPKEAQDFG